MKILITGYKGFIGQNMVKALRDDHQLTYYEWGDAIPEFEGLDWVIHLGAISSTTETDVEKVMRQNHDFSCILLVACQTNNVNLQYASSASVYGLVSTFREDAEPDPRTPYAWSKYLTERHIQRHPMGARAQIFRYFNVYGPEGEEHKGSQASPYAQFKRQAETIGKIQVFEGSDRFLRDFVPVSQIVETHLKFLNVKESGVWNVGTGTPRSFMSVAKEFGVPIETVPMPDILKDSYQKYTCADMTRYNTTLSRL
jgi:ADP-L-glycero-D-manno-heptose 6-epimerase